MLVFFSFFFLSTIECSYIPSQCGFSVKPEYNKLIMGIMNLRPKSVQHPFLILTYSSMLIMTRLVCRIYGFHIFYVFLYSGFCFQFLQFFFPCNMQYNDSCFASRSNTETRNIIYFMLQSCKIRAETKDKIWLYLKGLKTKISIFYKNIKSKNTIFIEI